MLDFAVKIGLLPMLAVFFYFVLDLMDWYIRRETPFLLRLVVAVLGACIFCMFWYKLV